MKEIVKLLINKKQTISTMESCTGGMLANEITNIVGASEVLKFSAVTYSNEFKIKMGVDSNIIDKYTVYSIETAHEMGKKISDYTNSDYGVGITGKLNEIDKNNSGEDYTVYVSIYDKNKNEYYDNKIKVIYKNREYNKKIVIKEIINMLKNVL